MKKVVIDGDWGGDEMQLAAVLLANRHEVNVLGATCVFGNTNHAQVVENARNVMHFLRSDHVKVFPGSSCPSDSPQLDGDGAHGSDGIGNVNLEKSPQPYETKNAVDFILEQLINEPPKTVTITASGPLTNIANAITKSPDAMSRVRRVIIMGGCTHDMAAHDTPIRRGNITYYGEFNFQQAAADAQTVMNSGLPIALLPMNCTHQLAFTPERQAVVRDVYRNDQMTGNALIGMMTAPAHLDLAKFNSAPVMHDINCALFLLYPEGYEVSPGRIDVSPKDHIAWPQSRTGYTEFSPLSESNLMVATKIKNPQAFFNTFLQSITRLIPPP